VGEGKGFDVEGLMMEDRVRVMGRVVGVTDIYGWRVVGVGGWCLPLRMKINL
jgi:hypothetical protein